MAQNAIDLVITQDAIKQVDNLISKLSLAESEMLKLAQASLTASKSVSGISTPSGLTANSTNNAQVMADLQKQQDAITKLHDTLAKKAEQSRLAEIKLQQAREKAFDSFEKNSAREQAILDKQANSYNKTQSQITKLTAVYNDLATRKARYNDLNENEEKRLNTLQAVTTKYNTTLKDVDATIGKHTRNVGNYASGWNGLGNSINQLTREMPAFANSMQTGFMAISNNLPMLFDEITKIKKANVELVASGEPTKSVFKQLAGAVFSWGTALSVGVTLLTVYGADIAKWVISLFEANKGVQSLEENQKELNKTLGESSTTYAKQKVDIEVLYNTATNLNKSYKERKDAVDELQKQYPYYFKNLSDEAIMTGQAKAQYDALSQAILTVAQARAAEEILQKRESERLTKEQKNIEQIQSKYKDLAKAKNETTQSASVGVGGVSTTLGKSAIRRDIQSLRNDMIAQREQWAKEDAFFIDKIAKGNTVKQTLEPANKLSQAHTKISKDNSKSTDKAEKERLKAIEENKQREYEALLSNLNRQKEIDKDSLNSSKGTTQEKIKLSIQLAQDEINIANVVFNEKKRLAKGDVNLITIANNEKLTAEENAAQENLKRIEKFYEDSIKLTEKYYKENPPLFMESSEQKAAREKSEADAKKKLEENKAYLKSFLTDFTSASGFTETFKMLQGEIEGFGENWQTTTVAIMESTQEMFNFISNASQANFDAEYSRLEEQKNISLQFAGDSASAKKKIDEDYEKKKKEIANRENKAKQKQAMFNIAIDTAQAIMSIWSHSPDPSGISQGIMTGIISALGLAQIAMVASQKIPQYAQGTDNHKGGLMLVNDGKGSNYQEAVILPSGQVIQPQGRNVLMDAPAGTKVLTHEQQLQEMLSLRGISMSNTQKYEGMTANEMDAILSKHFSGIKTQSTIIDKNGFNQYVKNGNSRTIINAARFSGTGLSV
jgi:hypothetical protein